jgi:NAD(P)H dehydrogenase (quinone)
MVLVGLPWSEKMRRSGSYYGATAAGTVEQEDREQAMSLSARVAQVARLLKGE